MTPNWLNSLNKTNIKPMVPLIEELIKFFIVLFAFFQWDIFFGHPLVIKNINKVCHIASFIVRNPGLMVYMLISCFLLIFGTKSTPDLK